MHSLLVELEHKLANEEELTPELSEYLTDLLIKFQNVFFTDINMFDLNGNLLLSSCIYQLMGPVCVSCKI